MVRLAGSAPLSEEAHRRAWALYAVSYDRILPCLPFYQEVVQRHIAAMSESGILEVIDVGAGTGSVSVPLASRGRRVTAVDRSPEMLAQLLDKVSGEDRGRLTVLEQNAECLSGLADGSFDGATILLAFYDMSRPRAAFDEVVRVLRPGGSLVVTEPKATFQLQPLLVFVERFITTAGLGEQLREDWERVREANLILDPARREARLSVEEIRQRLSTSGFSIERGADSHLGQCATTWATKRN